MVAAHQARLGDVDAPVGSRAVLRWARNAPGERDKR